MFQCKFITVFVPRVQGFRVWGLGLRGLGLRVYVFSGQGYNCTCKPMVNPVYPYKPSIDPV